MQTENKKKQIAFNNLYIDIDIGIYQYYVPHINIIIYVYVGKF